jgi:hypothetical protein
MSREEKYSVTIRRDEESGIAVIECWEAKDRDLIFELSRDHKSGVIRQEAWFNAKHQLHRVGAPAVINRNHVTGKLQATYWYENGEKVPRPSRSRIARNPSLKRLPGLTGGPQ